MSPIQWLSLLAIWVLFFWLYRDYRVDLFRHRLFNLRYELFRLACTDKVAFDNEAYTLLRRSINGTIYFGHQFGSLELLLFAVCTKGEDGPVKRYQEAWQRGITTLPPSVQKELETIHRQVHMEILQQIFATSAILMFSLLTLVCWMIVYWFGQTVAKGLGRLYRDTRIRHLVDCYDYAAVLNSN